MRSLGGSHQVVFVGGPLDRQTRWLRRTTRLADMDGAFYTVTTVDAMSPQRSKLIAAGYEPAWAYAVLRCPAA